VTSVGREVVFEMYEGANHAFDNDDLLLHDAPSSQLAWGRTLAFLRQHLRDPVGQPDAI
jgi:carboxymethylenebutenolidase